MAIKLLGSILIIASCTCAGFSIASYSRKEAALLRQICQMLSYIQAELEYHLTPLPQLCTLAGREVNGQLKKIMKEVAENLNSQIFSDTSQCMREVLHRYTDLPPRIRNHLQYLGKSLGRFELSGQLRGLEMLKHNCEADIQKIEKNQEIRLRSYRTLGVCAGTALVILLA